MTDDMIPELIRKHFPCVDDYYLPDDEDDEDDEDERFPAEGGLKQPKVVVCGHADHARRSHNRHARPNVAPAVGPCARTRYASRYHAPGPAGRRVPQAGFVFRKPGPESASIDVEALMARFVAQRAQAMNEDWMDEQASHYGMSRDEWELSQWPDRD